MVYVRIWWENDLEGVRNLFLKFDSTYRAFSYINQAMELGQKFWKDNVHFIMSDIMFEDVEPSMYEQR